MSIRSLVALTVVPATVVAFAVTGCSTSPNGGTGPTSASAPTNAPTNEPTTGQRDSADVQALLDRRAAALLRRDVVAWRTTTTSTTSTTSTGDGDDALFTRLATVPVTAWRYQVLAVGGAIGGAIGGAVGDALVDVRLSYRLETDTRDVTRDQQLVVRRGTDGTLRVAATRPAPGAEADLWDVAPVTVVAGPRALVVVAGDDAPAVRRARDLFDLTSEAAVAVDGLWGTDWPRRAVVVAPATQDQVRAVLGARGSLGGLAALTIGVVYPGDGVGRAPDGSADRVVVDPGAFGRLTPAGRAVVLRHELTHVATRSRSPLTPPLWLQEGFATWVGYSGTGLPARIVAADALPAVRAGTLPDAVPADAAFDASAAGDVGPVYAQSWVLCDLVADEGRAPQRLVAFYRAAAGIDPPANGGSTASEPDALAAAFILLGRSPQDLVRQWRERLTGLAAGAG